MTDPRIPAAVPGSAGSDSSVPGRVPDARRATGPDRGRAGSAGAGRRPGPADPVRGLMHRHYDLCAGAVDPLEIAAGLEAHGVTDRVAGRFRHRDVFALAEELYARVPRADVTRPASDRVPRLRPSGWETVLHLLPGAGCAAVAGWGRSPVAGAVAGALVALATWAALHRGPLRASRPTGALWACLLLAFALCGPQVVAVPDGAAPSHPPTASFAALALSLGPAAWWARRFAVRARHRLGLSRSLDEFAARVRPPLATTLAGYGAALLVLLQVAAAAPAASLGPSDRVGMTALGLSLFTARLMAVHGFGTTAAAVLAAACAAEAAGTAFFLLGPAGAPDPATVSAVACGAAALVLTGCAFRVLARASAHEVTR